MQPTLSTLIEELTAIIQATYEKGTTLDEAEKLAARFLHAQMMISEELRAASLDSRMKKSGVKAIRAAVYMKEATRGDKKPSDAFLQNLVETDETVGQIQDSFDTADVHREYLENYLSIFKDAHLYYRNLMRGRFE